MIGSFFSRGLVMVLGYAYPAYECYKTVEMNKPEIEQLRFWCQYWILVAVLSVCERIGDAFISWIPMYCEAKVAFFVYLWFPKTRGTTYIYDSFFRPYIAMHENDIDRTLYELKTKAGDMAVLYWQEAASYSQKRVFDILQYIASQSTPRPRPAQNPQPQATRARQQPSAPNNQAAPETEEPPSPTSSTSSSQHQTEVAEVVGPSVVPKPPGPVAAAPIGPNKTANTASEKTNATSESTSEALRTEAEAMQIESVPPSPSRSGSVNPPPTETVMDEAVRVTRGRLRRTRDTSGTR